MSISFSNQHKTILLSSNWGCHQKLPFLDSQKGHFPTLRSKYHTRLSTRTKVQALLFQPTSNVSNCVLPNPIVLLLHMERNAQFLTWSYSEQCYNSYRIKTAYNCLGLHTETFMCNSHILCNRSANICTNEYFPLIKSIL